jgi:toxin CptA
MSGERQAPALRIELRASLRLAMILAVAHVAAIAIAARVLPNSAWMLGLCAVLVLNGGWTIWRHALLRYPGSIVALEFRGEGECSVRLRRGEWLQCRILPATYATPLLIVLNLKHARSWFRRYVVLFPDSIPMEVHRRLRVRLRWSKLTSAAEHPDASL